MQTPNEQHWRLLQAHASTVSNIAPQGVLLTAAPLIGEWDSLASVASVDLGDPTTWTFDIVAANTLAHGVVQYNRERFDAEEEGERFGPPPVMTVREAWVRPLATVTALSVEAPGTRNSEWFAHGALTLTFANGFEHRLPNQEGLHSPAKRQRSDDFHAALRTAIGF